MPPRTTAEAPGAPSAPGASGMSGALPPAPSAANDSAATASTANDSPAAPEPRGADRPGHAGPPSSMRAPRRATGLAPRWMSVPAVIALTFLLVPFLGILTGADWRDFPALIASEASLDALRLSAITTLSSTVVSAAFGIPVAYWIAAGSGPEASPARQAGAKICRTLVNLPIVLPPVVAGLALLLVFGKRGLIGQFLAIAGIRVGFTTIAVIIAQVFVAMPYLIVSLEGALRTRGFDLERTARSLGASRTRVLRTITLPLSAPAIASGLALTFSRSLGEFGATLTFAGSLQGTTRTLPLAIYLARESDTASALSMAIVLIAVAALVVGVSVFATSRWQARLFPTAPPPADAFTDPAPTVAPIDEDGAGRSAPGAADAPDAAGAEGARSGGRHTIVDTTHADALASAQVAGFSGKADPSGSPTIWCHRRSQGPEIRIDAEVAARDVRLNAHLAPGVVTAAIGPNGSGKSTLIGLLSGEIVPDSGSIEFGPAPDGDHGPTIALLSQRALLFPHMNVLDNAMYGLRARGVPEAQARRRALAELDALGIAGLAPRNATQLSGGQAQRVAIARAMVLDPDVVLLDEPMAALDVPVAQTLRLQLAARLAAARPTVLLATHDAEDVAALATDVVVIRSGEVVRSGPWREVLEGPGPDGPDDFLLHLTGRQAVALPGRERVVVRPSELRLEPAGPATSADPSEPAPGDPGPVGLPVIVEGRTWKDWGPALVVRTPDGSLLTVPMPEAAGASGAGVEGTRGKGADARREPAPGDAAVVMLRERGR